MKTFSFYCLRYGSVWKAGFLIDRSALARMGWKGCQEVANTKPLLTAIYATVIVGVIFSSFYVFSAIYSANSAANSKISWLSAPSVSFSSMFLWISHSLLSLYSSVFVSINLCLLLLAFCCHIYLVLHALIWISELLIRISLSDMNPIFSSGYGFRDSIGDILEWNPFNCAH